MFSINYSSDTDRDTKKTRPRLISDFHFWHVDRHKWKKQGSLTGFLKIISFGEMGHFGLLHIFITLGSARRSFKKFCTVKGLIGRWEWYNSPKKILFYFFFIFFFLHRHNSESADCKIFLNFAQWKGLIRRWK